MLDQSRRLWRQDTKKRRQQDDSTTGRRQDTTTARADRTTGRNRRRNYFSWREILSWQDTKNAETKRKKRSLICFAYGSWRRYKFCLYVTIRSLLICYYDTHTTDSNKKPFSKIAKNWITFFKTSFFCSV